MPGWQTDLKSFAILVRESSCVKLNKKYSCTYKATEFFIQNTCLHSQV